MSHVDYHCLDFYLEIEYLRIVVVVRLIINKGGIKKLIKVDCRLILVRCRFALFGININIIGT